MYLIHGYIPGDDNDRSIWSEGLFIIVVIVRAAGYCCAALLALVFASMVLLLIVPDEEHSCNGDPNKSYLGNEDRIINCKDLVP